MKYKIVQKNFFDDYYGREDVKFYIKKRNFLGLWYYANLSLDKIERIFGIFLTGFITLIIPILFAPLFAFFKFGGILFLISFILSYFAVKQIGSLIGRKSYFYLESAQDDIVKELKRIEFKNKTIDVVEISADTKQITIEKKI